MTGEILGVKIDNKLTFDCHVTSICKKTSKKVNPLGSVAPFINKGKRHTQSRNRFLSRSLSIGP